MKRAQIYPTLRCPLDCEYCSNKFPGYSINSKVPKEISPEKWIEILKSFEIETPFITGGEPLLYENLDILINALLDVTIYSNLLLSPEHILKKVEKKKGLRFRCSYHPGGGYYNTFLDNLKILDKYVIPYSVHMVDNRLAPKWRAQIMRSHRIEIGIDYDQRRHEHLKGLVYCSLSYPLFGPDGKIYHCVSRMRRGEDCGDQEGIYCEEPELCAPCDLAATYQKAVECRPLSQDSTGDKK